MKQAVQTFWKSLPRKRRKVCAWTVGLLLFYTLFGFIILPLIVKHVAIKQLSQQLDREVTIRHVRINPYALTGTIRGLLVKDKDGEPFLSLDEAYAYLGSIPETLEDARFFFEAGRAGMFA